jgi:hypothetical protein
MIFAQEPEVNSYYIICMQPYYHYIIVFDQY